MDTERPRSSNNFRVVDQENLTCASIEYPKSGSKDSLSQFTVRGSTKGQNQEKASKSV